MDRSRQWLLKQLNIANNNVTTQQAICQAAAAASMGSSG